MKPIWKHDRTCCKYLGSIANQDLYVCESNGTASPSYLCRWSDDPSEYRSHDDFGRRMEWQMKARSYSASLPSQEQPSQEHFERLVGIRFFADALAYAMSEDSQ